MLNLYVYKAINTSGDIVNSLIFANNESEIFKYLKDKNLSLVRAKKQKSIIKKPLEDFTLPFLKNLHQMISNKLDLITSLEIISKVFKLKEQKLIIKTMIFNIKNGLSLSESLSIFSRYFDELTIKIIEISEKTARLSDSILNIITYLEVGIDTKRKIQNSLRYPIILFICIFVVVMFWFLFVVPSFSEIFLDMDAKLPFITKCIISFSSLLTNNIIYIILFLMIFILYIINILNNKQKKEKIMQKIPVLKKIKREIMVINFFSRMSIMLKEKINLIDALRCLNNKEENPNYISDICSYIEEGNTLYDSMKKSKIFNSYEISIIESGEKSGDLQTAFKSASDLIKSNLQYKLQKIITIIQPVSIILVGVLLLIMIYSVIFPMYSNLNFDF